MAILTANQLAELRRNCAKFATVNYDKTQINAALQALEDDWNTFLNRANADIENAAPGVFTLAQKIIILRVFLWQKVKRDGGV